MGRVNGEAQEEVNEADERKGRQRRLKRERAPCWAKHTSRLFQCTLRKGRVPLKEHHRVTALLATSARGGNWWRCLVSQSKAVSVPGTRAFFCLFFLSLNTLRDTASSLIALSVFLLSFPHLCSLLLPTYSPLSFPFLFFILSLPLSLSSTPPVSRPTHTRWTTQPCQTQARTWSAPCSTR